MALNFPNSPVDGQIYVDPTTESKYVYVAASTKWKSIQHTGVITAYGFDKANSAYLTANASFASINSNWTVQNALYTVANAAFDSANNVGPQIAPTYNTANAAFGKANAALANTSGTYFSGDLFFPSGNVAIGETSANARLLVTSYSNRVAIRGVADQAGGVAGHSIGAVGGSFSSVSFNAIQAQAAGAGYGAFITSSSGYGAYIASITGSPLVVGKYAGSDYLTVTTSGNTGFGTSTPAYKIDVAGAANISNPTLIVAGQNVVSTLNAAFGVANNALANVSNVVFSGNLTITGALQVGTGTVRISSNSIDAQSITVAGSAIPSGAAANLAFDTANAAYGAANNVGPQIAPAFNTANAAFAKANTALQNTSGTFSGNLTVTGTMNVSSGINATTASPYIFNKPTPAGYQTVMQVGSANNGFYLITDNANIAKGCYYNSGWIATSSIGNKLDFNGDGYIEYQTFSGAAVGSTPTFSTYRLVHTGNFMNSKASSGYTYLPNNVLLQWGSQSVGGDREVDYSFPIAFPNGCYGFAASGDWWGTNGWMAVGGRPINASVYRLYNIVEGTLGVWWIAMGY